MPAADTYPERKCIIMPFTPISHAEYDRVKSAKKQAFLSLSICFPSNSRLLLPKLVGSSILSPRCFYSLFSSLPFHCRHMARDVIFPDSRSVFRFFDRFFLLPCLSQLQSFRLRILPNRKALLHAHTAGSFRAPRLSVLFRHFSRSGQL